MGSRRRLSRAYEGYLLERNAQLTSQLTAGAREGAGEERDAVPRGVGVGYFIGDGRGAIETKHTSSQQRRQRQLSPLHHPGGGSAEEGEELTAPLLLDLAVHAQHHTARDFSPRAVDVPAGVPIGALTEPATPTGFGVRIVEMLPAESGNLLAAAGAVPGSHLLSINGQDLTRLVFEQCRDSLIRASSSHRKIVFTSPYDVATTAPVVGMTKVDLYGKLDGDETPPSDHHGLACASLCLCPLALPVSVCAVCEARRSRNQLNAGNVLLAAKHGRKARRLARFAIFTGLLLWLALALFAVFGFREFLFGADSDDGGDSECCFNVRACLFFNSSDTDASEQEWNCMWDPDCCSDSYDDDDRFYCCGPPWDDKPDDDQLKDDDV